jgi:hypothetical protein
MMSFIHNHLYWFVAIIITVLIIITIVFDLLHYIPVLEWGILRLLVPVFLLIIFLIFWLTGWKGIAVLVGIVLISIFFIVPGLFSRMRAVSPGENFLKMIFMGILALLAAIAVGYGVYLVFWQKIFAPRTQPYIEVPLQPKAQEQVQVIDTIPYLSLGINSLRPGSKIKVIRKEKTNFYLTWPSDKDAIISFQHAADTSTHWKLRFDKKGYAHLCDVHDNSTCNGGLYWITTSKPVVVYVQGTL